MARPSDYSQEMAATICSRLADGESLRSICRDEGMPDCSTVFRWIAQRDEFRNQYACAREAQADAMFEDLLDIADETSNDTISGEHGDRANGEWITRSKLRVDTRKWMLARMVPKKYGDRVTNEHIGEGGAPIAIAVNFIKPA